MTIDRTPDPASASVVSDEALGSIAADACLRQTLNDGRVPIIIGVTGHRDLRPDDIAGLEARVREFYLRLRSTYSNTPVVTLSPLAEGADRLVAKVALEQGSSLIVPLPMPEHEHEEDFETEDSKLEFRELLAQAQASFVVSSTRDTNPADANPSQVDREQAYLNVGMLIARHSHVLLALWNGLDTGCTGGTSQIVGFRLDGQPDPLESTLFLQNAVDDGPVYQVVTPRLSETATNGKPLSIVEHYPVSARDARAAREGFEAVLRKTDEYNRDVAFASPVSSQIVEKAKSYVLPQDEQASLSRSSGTVLHSYGIADALAMRYQAKRRRIMTGLFTLVVLAFLFFQVYAYLIASPFLLLCYPLLLSVAYILYFRARRREYQDKHLEYRALAEGLRVQFFWLLAGIDEDPSEHYLQKHAGNLDWIRRAIRAVRLMACTPENEGRSGSCVETVREHWVVGQLSYFTKARSRDERRVGRQEVICKYLFASAMLLVFVVLYLELFGHSADQFWKSLTELILEMQLAVAAAVAGFSEKMAFAEQAKQYSRMEWLFRYVSDKLDLVLKNGNADGAKRLFRNLGIEALAENGDWVVLHKSRPMGMPK